MREKLEIFPLLSKVSKARRAPLRAKTRPDMNLDLMRKVNFSLISRFYNSF